MVTAAAALFAGLTAAFNGNVTQPNVSATLYPVGTSDHANPSGMAPPAPNALTGYVRTYVNDFAGSSLPAGWQAFSGVPGSDPQAHFALDHVVVSRSMLQLKTERDPDLDNAWATGGVCQCTFAQKYGAYFVRSRITGPGAAEVLLLWPANNKFPPEIDFSETSGAVTGTSATIHYTAANNLDQRFLTGVLMTKWHTWGVVWTPSAIRLIVDGREWGTVSIPSEVPSQPMTLHLQEQTSCFYGLNYACPTSPDSAQIDWVAEYARP